MKNVVVIFPFTLDGMLTYKPLIDVLNSTSFLLIIIIIAECISLYICNNYCQKNFSLSHMYYDCMYTLNDSISVF